MGLQSHFIVKPNLVLRLGWGLTIEKLFIKYLRDFLKIFELFSLKMLKVDLKIL